MKRFLLLGVALFSLISVTAQTYSIPTELSNNTTYNEPTGYTISQVSGSIIRSQGVIYNHNNPGFEVGTAWHTIFTDVSTLGAPSSNKDYFNYQGVNTISNASGDAVIIFDTVYFNNGNNAMNISSYNAGFRSGLDMKTVPGSIIVTRLLAFNNGITTTNRLYPVNGAIVFSNNASYTGGLTNQQHVNGYVTEANYAGNPTPYGHGGEFTYPVGNGTYAYPLTRQGVFDKTDSTITVGWIQGDPAITPDPTFDPLGGQINDPEDINLASGVVAVGRDGFWDWQYQGLTGAEIPHALSANQTVTVKIPDFTNRGVTASQLRLVGWDVKMQWWINLSGNTGATGITRGSELTGVIPGGTRISALAVGSTSAILPVTFGNFTVTADACKVLLNWQTSFEQSNNYFKVERSANGRDFVTIGTVNAAGNSTAIKNYQFTDAAPLEGLNYYRITQVDYDGKQSNTDVKTIRIQCNGTVATKIYPNPAKHQINLLTGKAVAQVHILNSGGQQVLKHTPSVNQGGTFSINISRLPTGVYILQTFNRDGTTHTSKFIKE